MARQSTLWEALMHDDAQMARLFDDAILRAIRAGILAGAVAILTMAQQHFSYPTWKVSLAAFLIALPRRSFPLIVYVLAFLCLLALLPPAAVASLADFILRLRG